MISKSEFKMNSEDIIENPEKQEGQGHEEFRTDEKKKNTPENPTEIIDNKPSSNEREIFNEISKIENAKERQEKFNAYINGVIGEFENSEKTDKDFILMMEKFSIFPFYGGIDETSRAWNQEQVDKVIKIYEENAENIEDPERFFLFEDVLTGPGVSHLAANSIMKRIESGQKISSALKSGIVAWASEDLEYLDPDTASDFLVTLMNNPNQIERYYLDDILDVYNIENLERFVYGLKKQLYENKKDIYKSLRIIEALYYFKYDIDEKYSEKLTTKNILKEFKKSNDNFFLNFRSDQILEFDLKDFSEAEKRRYLKEARDEFFKNCDDVSFYYEDLRKKDILSMSDKEINEAFELHRALIDSYLRELENLRRKNLYEDNNFRENYDIEPLSSSDYLNPEEAIKDFCYTRISDKYGIIYTPEGGVDSFFGLNQEIKEYGAGKTKPERLNISEILAKEGFKKENMNEGDYKKMILTYKTLIELPMREKIEKEFGIELANFNIREQVQFVNFLSSKSIKEIGEVKEFLDQAQSKERRNSRIKSFLSLEASQEMGDKILSIGENLDSKSADSIFAKYAEIVNLTQISREGLESLFKDKKEVRAQEIENITQNLLKKANELLINFAAKSEQVKKEELDISEILKELKRHKRDLILPASVFKGIDKETGVKFEDLKGVTFEQKKTNDFSEEEKKQMLEIYKRNYEDKPRLQKEILSGLEEIFERGRSDVIVYLFKKDNNIVAFNRFDKMNEDRKHFASFNVEPSLKGSDIGMALLEVSLEKETQKSEIIEADCIPAAPISASYVNKCGFVIKRVLPNYLNTGETLFHIEKKEANKKNHYHNYNDRDVIDEYSKQPLGLRDISDQAHFILKFEVGSKDLLKTAEKFVNKKGYLISRYLFSKDKKEVYCGFEKAV